MRVNINLASRKYEDVRRFVLVWTTTLVALSFVALALSVCAYFKHVDSARAAAQTRDLQDKVNALTRQRNELKAFENQPENRDVTQQKQFWNNEIMRRSFSWTLLFNDLQKIMPPRVYVNSVQPELTAEGRLRLKLTVSGETQDDTLELIRKMESSSRFQSPRPTAFSVQRDTGVQRGPRNVQTYKCDIETYYIPASPAAKTAAREGM